MPAVCPNCNKPVQIGARFCGTCGTPISQDDRQPFIPPSMEFRQYRRLDADKPGWFRPHHEIDPYELKKILKDLEQGRGNNFEHARQILKEKRPLGAVEPLWKMKNQIFVKDNVEKVIYEILTEIGSEKVVDLILDEIALTSDDAKMMAYTVLGNELPQRAVPWLGKMSDLEESPFDIVILEILRRIGNKQAIIQLVKHSNSNFTEDLSPRIGKNLLLNVVVAGVAAYRQSIDRDMAATLLTAPFLPLELLTSVPEIIQKSQVLMYRVQVLAELAQKHGLEEVEKLYDPKFLKSASLGGITSMECCLTCAVLLAGKAPQFINIVIKNVIENPRKKFIGDKISAAVLTYYLTLFSKEKNSNMYFSGIMAAVNDKDHIVSQSAIASSLYLNYTPIISSALNKISTSDARYIPALAYCAFHHDNQDCKNLFYHIEMNGNKDIKKAASNWHEIVTAWKKL